MRVRHLLLTFTLAFALGIIAAVYLLQPAPIASETTAEAKPALLPADKKTAPDAVKPHADDIKTPDDSPDDDDDAATKWPDDAGTPEQVMYAQRQLMDDAIGRLAARAPGKANLYVIAFAGDGSENVFRNEAEYVERLFTERFDAVGHTLVLINNPATLSQRPLASLSNLQIAVDAVADKIDAEQDILLLFLTSHGSSEHELFVSLDPLPLDSIEPDDLVDLFADTKIHNKVVVISACYSGGFIDALKGPSTMVITAARADRSSFGCGTQSQITDFGRAFLADGLNHNDSIDAAFAEAQKLVNEWETQAGEQHSEPQIVTSAQIEGRLKAWRNGIHLGPPVPFSTSQPRRPSAGTRTLTASN